MFCAYWVVLVVSTVNNVSYVYTGLWYSPAADRLYYMNVYTPLQMIKLQVDGMTTM